LLQKIADQFLFLVSTEITGCCSANAVVAGVDVAELRIPVGVAVAFRGLAVALQTVTRLIEQVGDQGCD
jgi:hypothetical protein